MSTIDPNSDESQSENAPFFMSPAGGLIVYRITQPNSPICSALNRPLLKGINHITKQVVLFHPRCKSWRCPACASINAQKATLRALNGAELLIAGGSKMDFLTVTSHEKLSPASSLAVLPKAWNKLNRRVKRVSTAPEYLAIPEQHKDGRWHLHALISVKLPRKWWKDNARACGLGYQSDVKEVQSLGGVAYYVAKYVSKTLENPNLPAHFRRIRPSAGWPKLPAMPENPDWQFMIVPKDVPMNFEAETYQHMGYTVVLADAASAWDWIEHFGTSSE